MAFNVLFSEQGAKFLEKIPKNTVAGVIEKIAQLSGFPRLPHLKMLSKYSPLYSFKIGDYKVLFYIEAKNIMVEYIFIQK